MPITIDCIKWVVSHFYFNEIEKRDEICFKQMGLYSFAGKYTLNL